MLQQKRSEGIEVFNIIVHSNFCFLSSVSIIIIAVAIYWFDNDVGCCLLV